MTQLYWILLGVWAALIVPCGVALHWINTVDSYIKQEKKHPEGEPRLLQAAAELEVASEVSTAAIMGILWPITVVIVVAAMVWAALADSVSNPFPRIAQHATKWAAGRKK